MTQLADLITVQSAQTISGYMLGYLASVGFPVQSWQPGGAERTRIMAFATAVADISGNYIPQAAAGGFLDYASLPWLQLTAAELYNLAYNPSTQTVGTMAVTTVAGAGPYPYTPGQIIAVFANSGRRYINTGSGTIAASATTNVTFAAEFTGAAYNDPSNANAGGGGLITLATPLPGVTVNNPAGAFSPVAIVGSGTGTVVPSGTPAYPHQVIVRADTTGQAAAFSWSYSLDGAPFVAFGVGNAVNLAGTGISLTFSDGSAGTSSFVAGMTLAVQCPGSWITSQGTDVESAALLAQRCRNRWASLSAIPTNGLYQLLATSTPVVGGQVTQIVVQPDSVINNQVNIVVAGPAGVLPVATVAAIQAYISPRVPITDKPLVLSPSVQAVFIRALVTASASQKIAADAAIQVAINNYVTGIGINGTLRISALIDVVMNVAGVVDVSGMSINGFPVNLTLGSATSFVLPSQPSILMAYTTVSP